MHLLGRLSHGLLCGPVVLQFIEGLGLLHGGWCVNAAALPSEYLTDESKIVPQPGADMAIETKLFSEKWVEEYSGDDLGCEMGRGRYTWRSCGFGSNINSKN